MASEDSGEWITEKQLEDLKKISKYDNIITKTKTTLQQQMMESGETEFFIPYSLFSNDDLYDILYNPSKIKYNVETNTQATQIILPKIYKISTPPATSTLPPTTIQPVPPTTTQKNTEYKYLKYKQKYLELKRKLNL